MQNATGRVAGGIREGKRESKDSATRPLQKESKMEVVEGFRKDVEAQTGPSPWGQEKSKGKTKDRNY